MESFKIYIISSIMFFVWIGISIFGKWNGNIYLERFGLVVAVVFLIVGIFVRLLTNPFQKREGNRVDE